MRFFIALVIFLLVCVGLFQLGTDGKGLESLIAPVPARLDTARIALESTAQAASYEAALIRDAQTETAIARAQLLAAETQTAQDLIAQRTAQAQEATAAVVLQQTREVYQVTVEAGQAQGTATAKAAATVAQGTAAAISIQATGDAIGIQAFATQQYQQVQINGLKVAQEEIKTDVYRTLRYWPAFASITLALGAMFFGVWLMKLRAETNHALIPRSLDGSAAGVIMRGVALNIDRSIGPVLQPAAGMLPVTAAQMEITSREQSVQGIRGLTRAGYSASARQAAEGMAARRPAETQSTLPDPADDLPIEAPWESLDSWSDGHLLPLGVGVGRTGISLDPDHVPHLLYAGTSGSGKTISGLRPLSTLALSAGWQVILLNPAAGDFSPLRSHPNLVSIPADPQAIIETMEWVAREVDRRSAILERLDASTYSRLADAGEIIGPRCMIVMDEMVALAQTAEGLLRARLWRAIVHLTSKGRKMGLSFVGATTDPTYRSLGRYGLTVRDNCGRIVFKVLDAAVSHAILGVGDAADALKLSGCQFLARLDSGLVRGAAFHPEDAQIRSFLARRPALPLPAPAFLEDGIAEKPESDAPVIDDDMSRNQRIRNLSAAGKSLNEIQREIFGFSGGQAYTIVKTVLGSNTSIDTTELPDSAPAGRSNTSVSTETEIQ